MKLSKSKIITIIILISVSLIELLWLQISMLNHAIELEREIFSQNVNAALNSIIHNCNDRRNRKQHTSPPTTWDDHILHIFVGMVDRNY